MLRYYSYYSMGGYKNLYLGSNGDVAEKVYYLPLLSVWEAESTADSAAKIRFDEMKSLPLICQMGEKNWYDFPLSALPMFSHGGYKILYRSVQGKTHALGLRDIVSEAKDELGRNAPFLIIITGDSAEDVRKLDVISAFFASYLKETERAIASFIGFDMDRNGLCFKLADFNSWLDNIVTNYNSIKIATTSSVLCIRGTTGKVALLAIPDGISTERAKTEQNIINYPTESVNMKDIISKADVEKIVNQLETVTKERDRAIASYATMKKIALGTCVAGFLIGMVLKSCSGN